MIIMGDLRMKKFGPDMGVWKRERDFWLRMGEKYSLRANLGIDGKEYRKYGTAFDVRLVYQHLSLESFARSQHHP